jgi:hypothetical protein
MADIFNPEEHRVISSWLGAPPAEPIDPDLTLDKALEDLGFSQDPGFYSREAAAVAAIMLTRIQHRLSNWTVARSNAGGELEIEHGRPLRDPPAGRTVELMPQHLFTINWADSGPGFSWPKAYYVTWLPQYERHIVTSSSDSDEVLGYCDFALGSFPKTDRVPEKVSEVIMADWIRQGEEGEPTRWEHFLKAGLIDEAQANAMADRMWPPEEPFDGHPS